MNYFLYNRLNFSVVSYIVMFVKHFSNLICFLGILYSCNNLLASDDNNDDFEETEEEASASLKIKSQTQLCSADYYIKGGGEKDKEEDRKRTDIGIGEKITLLLVGKPKGNIQELTWSIKGDGFEETNIEQLKGSQKISLIAKKSLTKDTSVQIHARTSEDKETKISINIKVPVKIEAKKFSGEIETENGLDKVDTTKIKFPKEMYGVIGFIELTWLPTNVSFTKIKAVERDGGLGWPGIDHNSEKPILASPHTGHGVNKIVRIRDKNNTYDMVADVGDIVATLNKIRNSGVNPQKFWWICKKYTHLDEEKKDSIFLGETEQIFTIEAIKFTITATIEKFGLEFKRNSNES